jgi:cytochrome b
MTSTTPEQLATRRAPAATRTLRQRLVTDAPTRVFHALFALSFVGAWLTAEGERLRALHITLGYTMAGLLVARVLWGVFGPRHARLAPMLRKLQGLGGWFDTALRQGSPGMVSRQHWALGASLVMTAALLALMAFIVPLTASGWSLDQDIGGEWMGGLHEFFGNGVLMLVLAHLALLGLAMALRRRNLALSMWNGRQEGAGPDLVRRPWRGIAALVVVAVLAWWTWSWLDSPRGLIPPGSLSQLLHGADD